MLHDELITSKLEPGGSVKDHIGKLRSIVGKLATIDVSISDEQYIIILLRSLSSDYDQFVVTLENIETLRVEDVHARIIREEQRKKTTEDKSINTALQSHTSWNDKRFKFKCFYCGKRGHKITECRTRKYDNRTKQSRSVRQASSSNTYAMIASNDVHKYQWFIDSGASYHLLVMNACLKRNL